MNVAQATASYCLGWSVVHLWHKVDAGSGEGGACSGLLDEAGRVVEEGGGQAERSDVGGVEGEATLHTHLALMGA